MSAQYRCRCSHADPRARIALALTRYRFATPEIRVLMRHVTGHAISGRTIKRLVRSNGGCMKRGRPASTPRVQSRTIPNLIELTCSNEDSFAANALNRFQEAATQFGVTPRQYLGWITASIRRGKCMMRNCLLCDAAFASSNSGERHCRKCQGDRRRRVREERRMTFTA